MTASARAMPMRARWPPENWCGYRRMSVGSSPTRFSIRPTYSTCWAPRIMLCATGASPTMSSTRMRGFSEAYGSWKIICILSCCLRAAAESRPASDAPCQNRSPAESGSRPDGHAPERGLAAAGFAYQPDDLARRHDEVDIVNRMHDLFLHPGAETVADLRGKVERFHEPLRHAFQFDERRHIRVHSDPHACGAHSVHARAGTRG